MAEWKYRKDGAGYGPVTSAQLIEPVTRCKMEGTLPFTILKGTVR